MKWHFTYIIALLLYMSSQAQWIQQGTKLIGTGSVGAAQQGGTLGISSDGKTAIISAIRDNGGIGATWIYTFDGNGFVQVGNKLVGTGSNGTPEQGISVAISGDGKTAICGGVVDNSNLGAAWIFTFNGTAFVQVGNKLVGTGNIGNSFQGYAVSLSNDGKIVAVGGPSDNSSNGAVWIYTFDGTNFVQAGNKIIPFGNTSLIGFGRSISMSSSGNTMVVGGYADNNYTGAIWIFTFNGSNFVQAGDKLVGTGYIGQSNQGLSVNISSDGQTIIVGGYGDNSNTGAVWIYTLNGANFVQAGNKLVGSGNVGASSQGYSVCISADGKTAVVGGFSDNSNEGAIWIYTFNGAGYIQTGSKLTGVGNIGAALQGISVGISNDAKLILSGGPIDNSSIGATWVFVKTTTSCNLPTITGISSNTSICSNISGSVNIAITSTGPGSLTYQWYKNETIILEATTTGYAISSTSNNSGTYKSVVSNICGSVTSTGINIVLSDPPSVSLDLSSINNLCNSVGSVSLSGGVPFGGVYLYNNNPSSSLDISSAGNYSILYKYTDINSCVNTASGILSITTCTSQNTCPGNNCNTIPGTILGNNPSVTGTNCIYNNPPPSFTYDLWNDTLYFNSTSKGDILTHHWKVAGLEINYVSAFKYTLIPKDKERDSLDVMLVVTDLKGCTDTLHKTIGIPIVTNSLKQVESYAVNIYPNPFNNSISIETVSQGVFSIYNILGQVVFTKVVSNSEEIDLTSLPSGSYYFQFVGNKSVESGKLIKSK